jgi:hypothetical protein
VFKAFERQLLLRTTMRAFTFRVEPLYLKVTDRIARQHAVELAIEYRLDEKKYIYLSLEFQTAVWSGRVQGQAHSDLILEKAEPEFRDALAEAQRRLPIDVLSNPARRLESLDLTALHKARLVYFPPCQIVFSVTVLPEAPNMSSLGGS